MEDPGPKAVNSQPTWVLVVTWIIGSGAFLGGIGTLFGIRVNRRLGVASNEREARADERDAEDRLIGRWQAAAERDAARADREQLRAERAERGLSREQEYSRTLQDHIWRGRPAPPPDRRVYGDE